MSSIVVNRSSAGFFIGFLWIVVTAFNINKAYHIDDTVHLEAAAWVAENPTRPLSGAINWNDAPRPLYEGNQPPLYFYLVAGTQYLLGDDEISLHLLTALFTLLSLVFFYRIGLLIGVKRPRTLLTLFAFCPAFIINQNLMMDIPILAASLGMVLYLLKAQQQDSGRYYFLAAIWLSAGLMIKYSLVPLLLVFLINILISRRWRRLPFLLVPIAVLIIWSCWNIHEFGSVQLLDRKDSWRENDKLIGYIGALGAVSSFSALLIHSLMGGKRMERYILIASSALMMFIPLVYFGFVAEGTASFVMNCLFVLNGTAIAMFLGFRLTAYLRNEGWTFLDKEKFTLLLCMLGLSSFVILFAPFNATRHVLLVIPFILLFAEDVLEKASALVNRVVLVCSVLLGTFLGISDWIYADFYRDAAQKWRTESQGAWSLGHWGWQWYSREAGMRIYSIHDELNVRIGDRLIFPKDISRQPLSIEIELDTIDLFTRPSSIFTFFSGKDYASLYQSGSNKPPWTLSHEPIDTVFFCRVRKEIDAIDIERRILKNPTWLEEVRAKALERGIPLEEMIHSDAQWLLDQARGNGDH